MKVVNSKVERPIAIEFTYEEAQLLRDLTNNLVRDDLEGAVNREHFRYPIRELNAIVDNIFSLLEGELS
jgi:hypothetical protein